MRIFYIQGTGHIIADGKDTPYPINKLVLANEKTGNTLEIKLDKLNRKLLTALFTANATGTMYEDENGVQCQIIELGE